MSPPSFAALVRTMGTRPSQLLDALQSLALQQIPCLPVVIVHGDDASYARVQALCDRSTVVLHASDTSRKRGYPVNVGLDYCLMQAPVVRYVFLLDDDDIVYPFFTSMMERAFAATGADVVYASSNRRRPGAGATLGYAAKPFHHLFQENFIASNSYAVRLDKLREAGLRMDEDLEYLEDWHFLLRMVELGFRFHPLATALSEFRTGPDNELPYLTDPRWEEISLQIRQYINASSFLVPGPELARMAQDSGGRAADEEHIARLRQRISELENSLSWRWMQPVRSIAGALLRIRGR